MKKIVIFIFLSISSVALGQMPTPEELDAIGVEDEFVSVKEIEIDAPKLVERGPSSICSISGPGSLNEISMQQSDCKEMVELFRQDYCEKWPKSPYTIKEQKCEIDNEKIAKGSCKLVSTIGVGVCQ